MWSNKKTVFGMSVAIVVVASSIVALGYKLGISWHKKPGPPNPTTVQDKKANRKGVTPRNLSLQPDAAALGRRLGRRFEPTKRNRSLINGTLTVNGSTGGVQIQRQQTDDGEEVEIKIQGQGALTWNKEQGALDSNNHRLAGIDRQILERLLLDSPDQFVLAQLRGASYFVVARNARPVNADDDYRGPFWNVIRMNDPESDESKRPQSTWRLYYLNTTTSLIDRVESDLAGQRVVAEFSNWTEQNGETIPGQIVWSINGQPIMQYNLNGFSNQQN